MLIKNNQARVSGRQTFNSIESAAIFDSSNFLLPILSLHSPEGFVQGFILLARLRGLKTRLTSDAD
ncbi:MAG TPA: hypothetical protein VKB86_13615 [Pyrinomonadaceae bacterium]|nr:hypothetical protein [Pyrinomonadaceae bacterium]